MTSGHSRYQEKHVNGWNFLVHWRELAKVFRLRNVCFDEQRSTPPITVEVDPVDYCNHSCTWCFTSSHRETDRLSKAEVHKITEELGEMGAKSVHFAGGGEPTLFRGFALRRGDVDHDGNLPNRTVLDSVDAAGLKAGLITNGSTLRILDADHLVKRLSWIRISIDAGTEDRYQEKHRPNGHLLKDVHVGIKQLIKSRAGAIYPTVGASFIFEENTLHMKDEILRFVSDMVALNVDYVQIKPENENGGSEADRFLESLRPEIELRLNGSSTLAVINAPNVSSDSDHCWYSHFGPVVGATGDMFACCYTYGMPEFRYGNIKEYGGSVRHLWESPERLKLASKIDPRACGTCRHGSFNKLAERLHSLGEDGWDAITDILSEIERGADISSLTIPEKLRWMQAGFVHYQSVLSAGYNSLLEYPVYRPSHFLRGRA